MVRTNVSFAISVITALVAAQANAARLQRATAEVWREQRDGGVYLDIEGNALSLGVPSSMRWVVDPMANHPSVNSLNTLRQTRDVK